MTQFLAFSHRRAEEMANAIRELAKSIPMPENYNPASRKGDLGVSLLALAQELESGPGLVGFLVTSEGELTMTKKHFNALAQALKAAKPVKPEQSTMNEVLDAVRKARFESELRRWILLVDNVANIAMDANPRFDHVRFIDACDARETV